MIALTGPTPAECEAFYFVHKKIFSLYDKADKNPGEKYSDTIPHETIQRCMRYLWKESADRPHNWTTPEQCFNAWIRDNEVSCVRSMAEDGHWILSAMFRARIYKQKARPVMSFREIMEHGPPEIVITEIIGRDYDRRY